VFGNRFARINHKIKDDFEYLFLIEGKPVQRLEILNHLNSRRRLPR